MTINKTIRLLLKEFNIDEDLGLMCLLGIYYNLDIEKSIPEDIIKSINLTKILSKDYKSGDIEWSIPLFEGQETRWDWVQEFVNQFGIRNPDRRGNLRDTITRMKDFFSKYPEYRKEDVIQATKNYFAATQKQFLMKSHKFIFDGAGVMKKSTLLDWCEKLPKDGQNTSMTPALKGKIL